MIHDFFVRRSSGRLATLSNCENKMFGFARGSSQPARCPGGVESGWSTRTCVDQINRRIYITLTCTAGPATVREITIDLSATALAIATHGRNKQEIKSCANHEQFE